MILWPRRAFLQEPFHRALNWLAVAATEQLHEDRVLQSEEQVICRVLGRFHAIPAGYVLDFEAERAVVAAAVFVGGRPGTVLGF